MSVCCLLNQIKYQIPFVKYYNPLLLIDVRSFNMKCQLTNTFMFFIENPRTNIDLVSGFFEFYFKSNPEDFTLGQVVSKALILYSSTSKDCEFMPCILFTSGFLLQEILIYLPSQTFSFHRELYYFFFPQTPFSCMVCLEQKLCYNVHNDSFEHMVCRDCLLCINSQCPLCRKTIR